jgi:hypothetical protein
MSYMFNLEDYEDVATLNRWFIENYPMGRSNLVTEFHDPVQGFIRVRAEIYRDVTDANPAVTNIAFGARDLYNRNMARYYCEDTATSALGRAIILIKGSTKTATRESMEQVNVAQSAIAQAKSKMAETAKEYVPIAKEDDPWTIREAEPAKTVDEAVAMVKDIIGGQTDRDIPRCSKCHDHKEMTWKTGTGKNGKPYANFSCWTCKDIIWYEVSKENGTWIPQKSKY